jgi:hypothetical protein
MKTRTMMGLMMAVGLAACAPPSAETARALPFAFVAPESCARVEGGWVVTDKGCRYDKPCQEAKDGRFGSVVLVRDDGTTKVLLRGLEKPNGITVDGDGNLWVAIGGSHELVVLRPDGGVIRATVEGAQLLNDTTAVPWHETAAWVSDSKTGRLHLAALVGDHIEVGIYAQLDGGPNGVAPAVDSDGVAVAGVGDFAFPGLAGAVRQIDPATTYGECGDWHGGAMRPVGAPPHRKLDGIVPFTHGGRAGYLVSAIYDTEANGLDATLWFLPAGGGAAAKVADLKPYGLQSAADIGIDPKTGEVCVPDLNGSTGVPDGKPGAKVLILSGLK